MQNDSETIKAILDFFSKRGDYFVYIVIILVGGFVLLYRYLTDAPLRNIQSSLEKLTQIIQTNFKNINAQLRSIDTRLSQLQRSPD
jgi:predicted negative regulator of RcsB-dependent stress response